MLSDDHGIRNRLVIPVAIVVVIVFVGESARALFTGDTVPFVIASGPFTALCGYVFGITMFKKS